MTSILYLCRTVFQDGSSTLLACLLTLSVVAAPASADEEVGRIEIHTFESVTLTDQQFLQGVTSGVPVTLSAELRIPRQKKQQYPAVLLIHGSGGISGYVDDWASHLNSMGVATYIVDSFTGRGLVKVNNDQAQLGRLAMIVDAYRALDVLAKHKSVDKSRIVLMGFSRGGQVALNASIRRFHKMHAGGSDNSFVAYVPFYPACGTQFKDDENVANQPIRIFHGTADNYSPIAPCRDYVKRLKQQGKDVVLYELEGAHHVFDYTKLVKPVVMKQAQTTRNCALAEASDGIILNAKSGQPFNYSDPCVEYGPTIAFHREAYETSKQTLDAFLDSLFNKQLSRQDTKQRTGQ